MRAFTIMMLGLMMLATAPVLQAQEWVLKTSKDVLEANIEATGGVEAWAGVKTMKIEANVEFDSPMGGTNKGTYIEHIKLPGYSHRESTITGAMGQQAQTLITTPEKSWAATAMGRRDIARRNWISLDAPKEEIALLADEAYKLAALETEIADTGPIYVVAVEHGGKTYKRHYDQISQMLLAAERPSAQGGKEWVYYSDYREVDGLKVPHSVRSEGRLMMQRGGGSPEEYTIEVRSTIEKIAFNVPVSDDLFSEK